MTTETFGTWQTVEDEEVIRESTCIFTDRMGLKAEQADDAIAALKILKTETPDIIITVMNMPRMDGMSYFWKLENLKLMAPPVSVHFGIHLEQIHPRGINYPRLRWPWEAVHAQKSRPSSTWDTPRA